MEGLQVKAIVLVFLFVFGVAIALTTSGFNYFSSVDAGGAVQDSPVFYIFLVLAAIMSALLLGWIFNHKDSSSPFSTLAFLNGVLSAVLIGAMVHEFVHVLLISHPVQLIFHFGSPTAIFSTCCLLPGEYPYEEVAYVVQFFVMAAWVYLVKGTFFVQTVSQKKESEKVLLRMDMKPKAKGKVDYTDPSWEKHKKEVESYLGFGNEKEAEKDSLADDAELERLKIKRLRN